MKAIILTFLAACMPFGELRLAIPLAVFKFGMPIWMAFWIALAGNLFAMIMFRLLLPHVERVARAHSPWVNEKLEQLFHKTRTHHSKKMETVGSIFLLGFVAIPIPGSGALSGMLVSYVFGIPFRRSVVLVGAGLVLSGLVMLTLVFGVNFFL
jgi:uncharacterized membrane protein